MDKRAAHHRLTEAGLDARRTKALTDLLWNVHETGEIREVDFAHLSDAGFRHVDVCVMRELLTAALSRRDPDAEGPVQALLGAFGDAADGP
jgi:hypothetical protein